MDAAYADRDLNVGFSGGEKKKAEILQMLMLEPKLWRSWTRRTPAWMSTRSAPYPRRAGLSESGKGALSSSPTPPAFWKRCMWITPT